MKSVRSVFERVRVFAASEDGPTATEYAILLALLILVAVGAIGAIGSRVHNLYAIINDAITLG